MSIHLGLDNDATHKTPAVERGLVVSRFEVVNVAKRGVRSHDDNRDCRLCERIAKPRRTTMDARANREHGPIAPRVAKGSR